MKVYLSEYVHQAAVQQLEARAEIVTDFEQIEQLDAIILRTVAVSRDMMERATKLKVIGKHGVGYDSIDIEAAKELGKRVVYTPGTNTESVAELIIGLMLDAARNITQAHMLTKSSQIDAIAPAHLMGCELDGCTLGLVGLGNISQIVASRMQKGFDMDIIGYDPFLTEEQCAQIGIKKYDSLENMLENADFISISVPLNAQTRHMIGEKQLRSCKKTAILINASRGGVVDEQALYQALSKQWLRCAASDVFMSEPPNGKNPLFQLPNFIGTPHMGANTVEAGYRVGMMVVEDVLRVLDGEEPLHPVV